MTPDDTLKGRPVSLHVLDYGLFRVHSGPRDIGICGYLITTDADEAVLIDTGFPSKYARDFKAAGAEDGLDSFGEVLACSPGNLPLAQLARAGCAPERVSLMVQTHTHIDHIGGLALLPHAPMLIGAGERALDRPLYWSGTQPMAWPDRRYVTIKADTRIGPGFEVLYVPGHAPGQLAMLIDLPQTGPLLLTGDAISRAAEIDEHFAGSWDVELACLHGARLMDLSIARGASVIYGHCPEQWPKLRKAPEAYL